MTLKRDMQEMQQKTVERRRKVSHFIISINIVSSNHYSDFYLRHASGLETFKLSYRQKFLQSYR